MQALRTTHMSGPLACTCSSAPQERAPASARPAVRALPRGLGAATAASTALTALGAATARAAAAIEASSLPSLELPEVSLPDVDFSSIDLSSVDPLLVGGAVLALAVPAGIVALASGGSSGPKAKAVPAARALEALAADESCILLDIRSRAEVKEEGTPNLKGLSRRGAVSLPYVVAIKGEESVDAEFGAKAAKVKGLGLEGGPVILLDSGGAVAAAAAAAILAEVPLEKLYYVQGGTAAWQAAGGPWREPGKGFNFELPNFGEGLQAISGVTEAVTGAVAEAPEAAKGALVFAGVVGASALLFTQLEILFELAGVLAAGQFLLKVAFAEDREKTLTEIKKVVDEVDVADLPQDLSKITSALLDDPTASPTEIRRAQAAAAVAVAAASPVAAAAAPAAAPASTPVAPPAAPAPASPALSSNSAGAEAKADV